MILTVEKNTLPGRGPDHAPRETRQRREAMIRCLRRMGFHDPEALLDADEAARTREVSASVSASGMPTLPRAA